MKRYISYLLALVMLLGMLPVISTSAATALTTPIQEGFENVEMLEGSVDGVDAISSYKATSVKADPARSGSALYLGDAAQTTTPELQYTFASSDNLTLELDVYPTSTSTIVFRLINGSTTTANTALWLEFRYNGVYTYDGSWTKLSDSVMKTNQWNTLHLVANIGTSTQLYLNGTSLGTIGKPGTIGTGAATVNAFYLKAAKATQTLYLDNVKVSVQPSAEGFEGAAAGSVPGAPFVDVKMATVESKANAATGSKMAVYLKDTVAGQTAELRYPIADTTALVAEFDVYAVSSTVAFRITNGSRTSANSAFWMRIGTGKNVGYNDGSWKTLKTLDSSIVGRWVNIRIEANLEVAKIYIDGEYMGDAQRTGNGYGTNAQTAIDSLVIACGDNTYATAKFYVDNIRVTDAAGNTTGGTTEDFENLAQNGDASTISGYKSSVNTIVAPAPERQGEMALLLSDPTGAATPKFDYSFPSATKLTVGFDFYMPASSTTFTFQIYNGSNSTGKTALYLQFNYAYGLRVYDGSKYYIINSGIKPTDSAWHNVTVGMTTGGKSEAIIYVDGKYVTTTDVTCGLQSVVNGFYILPGSKTQSVYIDNLYLAPTVDVDWVVDGVTTTTQNYAGLIPTFDGTPVKAADAEAHYIFTGWDKAETPAAAGDTYTAQFDRQSHNMSQWQLNMAAGLHTAGTLQRRCDSCDYAEEQNVSTSSVSGFVITDDGAYLSKDVTVDALTVEVGKTLDLNGYTLTAGKLACFGSIVDSGNGQLITDALTISELRAMPVYDSANGAYKFYDYQLKNLGVRKNADGSVTYGFALSFTDSKAYALLRAGNTGVAVAVDLSWGENSKTFAFDAAFVQQYAAMKAKNPNAPVAMMLTVSGLNLLDNGAQLTVVPAVTAEGITKIGTPMSYTNDASVEGDTMLASAQISVEKNEMAPGESLNAKLNAVMDTASNPITQGYTVTWRSRTPSVATVDENGKITAVAAGTAKIQAIIHCNGRMVISNELSVEIRQRTAPVSVEAEVSEFILKPNGTGKITATACNYFGEEITDVQWNFESLTPELICVDAEGNYRAVAAGTAKLQVTALGGGESVSKQLDITVNPAWDTDGDGVLEILAIGNSFSVDALEYAYQIAQDLGIEKVAIGNLFIGGCSLETHAANAAGDLGAYTYYFNDNGLWTMQTNYKLGDALKSRSWDFVSMQQSSNESGVAESYNENLTNLIDYVRTYSAAELVWHMTWAYQQNSNHAAFPTYNKDQITMYNAIVSAVQNKILPTGEFGRIVPNGTAVQNARASVLGDTITRDGYHMRYDFGRYMTGLLFIKTLTGLSIDNVTYAPDGLTDVEKAIAKEAVNSAYEKPFEVTFSSYTAE